MILRVVAAVLFFLFMMCYTQIQAAPCQPNNDACVVWFPWNSSAPWPSSVITSTTNGILDVSPNSNSSNVCSFTGYIAPCFATVGDECGFGHVNHNSVTVPRSTCLIQPGVVSPSYLLAAPGKQWAQRFGWLLTQKGDRFPPTAISNTAGQLLARATVPTHREPFCTGRDVTGWVSTSAGILGDLKIALSSNNADWITFSSFEVAICGGSVPNATTSSPKPTNIPTATSNTTLPPSPTTFPPSPTTLPPSPTTLPPSTTTLPPSTTTLPPSTTTLPPSTTTLPPSPTTLPPSPTTLPPTPSPTSAGRTYIRFGNTVPSMHQVDAVLTQNGSSFTWTDYAFGEFSDWSLIFQEGPALLTVYENMHGTRILKPLLSSMIGLAQGPIVIVIKDYWPPTRDSNIEVIAASFRPVVRGSSGRLFNLSPDTWVAGFSSDGRILEDAVEYSLSSEWYSVSNTSHVFREFETGSNKTLDVDQLTPPSAPYAFTLFLIGLQNPPENLSTILRTHVVPLIDTPPFIFEAEVMEYQARCTMKQQKIKRDSFGTRGVIVGTPRELSCARWVRKGSDGELWTVAEEGVTVFPAWERRVQIFQREYGHRVVVHFDYAMRINEE